MAKTKKEKQEDIAREEVNRTLKELGLNDKVTKEQRDDLVKTKLKEIQRGKTDSEIYFEEWNKSEMRKRKGDRLM